MILIISIICLLGMYKGWGAFRGCVSSSAFKPAFNMLLITILFLSLLIITLYVARNYNIEKKYNLKSYGEQRITETGMHYL